LQASAIPVRCEKTEFKVVYIFSEMRKRFQCEQCKEKFINNSNLKVHMRVCSGKVKEMKAREKWRPE
jgi:uncharacterized Zn-finger protein